MRFASRVVKVFLSVALLASPPVFAISTKPSTYKTQAIESEFPGASKRSKIQVSIVSREKANELFREMKSDGSLAMNFPIEGCHARAMGMARSAEAQGIQMAKVFAEGDLQMKPGNSKFPIVQWTFHVAPTVFVEQPDGKVEMMVFDPTLFDHPVRIEEWKSKLDYVPRSESEDGYTEGYEPKVRSVYFGSRFQYGPRSTERSRANWKQADLDDATERLKIVRQLGEEVADPDLKMIGPSDDDGSDRAVQ